MNLKATAPALRTQTPVVPNPSAQVVRACWVCLRSSNGKLLARFDSARGLLEIRAHGETQLFDLVALQTDNVESSVK